MEQLGRQLQEAQQRAEEGAASADMLHETQRQLSESDSLVQQQARVIAQMEQQLLVQDARCSVSGNGANIMQQQQQQLQSLEAENASLRQALQQAQAQLVSQSCSQGRGSRCSSPGSASGQQQVAELQAKLARLQSALALKEEQHQRQLRSLRHEHERLRVEQGIRCGAAAWGARFLVVGRFMRHGDLGFFHYLQNTPCAALWSVVFCHAMLSAPQYRHRLHLLLLDGCRAASKAGAARVRELEAQLALEREASARKLRLLESRLKVRGGGVGLEDGAKG